MHMSCFLFLPPSPPPATLRPMRRERRNSLASCAYGSSFSSRRPICGEGGAAFRINLHRGTSPIRKRPPPGPYSRLMARVLGGS